MRASILEMSAGVLWPTVFLVITMAIIFSGVNEFEPAAMHHVVETIRSHDSYLAAKAGSGWDQIVEKRVQLPYCPCQIRPLAVFALVVMLFLTLHFWKRTTFNP